MFVSFFDFSRDELSRLGVPSRQILEAFFCSTVSTDTLIYSRGANFSRLSDTVRICVVCSHQENITEIRERYGFPMNEEKEKLIEDIQSEIDDDYSDDSLFNISSWGADLSFRELISMYEEEELVKPELQRKYVWDRVEASRFIESILLGLPVPSIFLARSGSQKLIVDGYQRIMTIYDYIRGIFTTDGKIFRLSNSEKINARWRNKSFAELSRDEQRKLRSTTIHAIIFEQKKPENDDTSLYQIFERINTSGRTLTPQEIRNCVYQGSLNTLLFELNEFPQWRKTFGTDPDSRMRDLEYILRFFVMKSDDVQNSTLNQISLKKVLNDYMGKHRSAAPAEIDAFRTEFTHVIAELFKSVGGNVFHNYLNGSFSRKFHPAIFDAFVVAAHNYLQSNSELPKISEEQHIKLLEEPTFKTAISVRTTDTNNIKLRIKMVYDLFAGESQ